MELLKKLVAEVAYQPGDEVTVGIFSTLVKSPSGCGIASTLRYAGLHQGVRNAGKLEQLSLSKLARFLFSENLEGHEYPGGLRFLQRQSFCKASLLPRSFRHACCSA